MPSAGTTWHRPPADVDVRTFFETWLPEAYVANGCEAAADAPIVRVGITGKPAGGTWQIELGGAQISVKPLSDADLRTSPTPGVWIRQSAEDFLAAFHPGDDLPQLLPPGWSALDLLFLDPRDTALLRQISGRLLVEITGRRRRRWALDVALGPAGMAAGRPRATVRIDGTTYEGLAQGTVAPLQALVSGKVQVDGDRALAMQGLVLLGSRLAR